MGSLVEKRAGILLFVFPLSKVRVFVQRFDPYPQEHTWLDFIYSFLFFILGYIIYSDDRFLSAVRIGRWLIFASGIAGLFAFFALSAVYGEDVFIAWGLTYIFPGSFIANLFFSLICRGWALFVFSLAITGLNFSNKWLVY